MAGLIGSVMTSYRIEKAQDSQELALKASEFIAIQISLALE